MNFFTKNIAIALVFTPLCVQALITSQDTANRLGAAEFREVTFERNATNITDSQKEDIKKVINEAASRGQIDHIKVLAWGDQDLPSPAGQQPKSEINLAKDRVRYLKSFIISDLRVASVDSYNMTDIPNAFEKQLMNTETSSTISNSNAHAYDMKAQAAKGVLMIFMKR